MLKALHAPADALVVMDAGIATEDNVAWLRDNGYRYRNALEDPTRHNCYSEERAKKEEGIARRFAERFESELRKLHDCRGPAPARGSTPSGRHRPAPAFRVCPCLRHPIQGPCGEHQQEPQSYAYQLVQTDPRQPELDHSASYPRPAVSPHPSAERMAVPSTSARPPVPSNHNSRSSPPRTRWCHQIDRLNTLTVEM